MKKLLALVNLFLTFLLLITCCYPFCILFYFILFYFILYYILSLYFWLLPGDWLGLGIPVGETTLSRTELFCELGDLGVGGSISGSKTFRNHEGRIGKAEFYFK